MKPFIFILMALTWAAPGYATVGPDPDQIGVYFDTEAEITCVTEYVGTPISAYVIITNPTFPDIRGVNYSFCLDTGGNDLDVLVYPIWPPGCFGDIDPIPDFCLDGPPVHCPYTPDPSGTEVVAMTFSVRLFGHFTVDFYLGPLPGADGEEMPTYWGEDGVHRPLSVSSGDLALPVATIGGDCPVPVGETTFARVKCLYR